jgi:hypothetical protein
VLVAIPQVFACLTPKFTCFAGVMGSVMGVKLTTYFFCSKFLLFACGKLSKRPFFSGGPHFLFQGIKDCLMLGFVRLRLPVLQFRTLGVGLERANRSVRHFMFRLGSVAVGVGVCAAAEFQGRESK